MSKKDLFESNQTYDTLNVRQQTSKDTTRKNEMKLAKTILDDEKYLSSQELNRIKNIEDYPLPEDINAVIEPKNMK